MVKILFIHDGYIKEIVAHFCRTYIHLFRWFSHKDYLKLKSYLMVFRLLYYEISSNLLNVLNIKLELKNEHIFIQAF
jgi:hypothetical protein